jgi:NAD(P)-dependent dehydrogenase (short-subunit alcohol dehydrogenase family)
MCTLSNKVAIITGASSGIGRATALLFAKQGASVIVAARRRKELDTLVNNIESSGGEHAYALAGDVCDEAFAKTLVSYAIERLGRLDIAFNNAGILGALGPTPDLSLDEWNKVIASNLTSAFMGAKYQLPAMAANKGGSIIFTASFVGYTAGMPEMAAYAASKAGLIGLTQALAVEHASQGIRVNALLPGGTNTPMGREAANSPESLAIVRNLHALKRMAEPDEIAQSALYLASDMSSFTTGSAMLVDGGISINHV